MTETVHKGIFEFHKICITQIALIKEKDEITSQPRFDQSN